MVLRHTGIRLLAVALLAGPALTGCGGDATDEESAPDLLARAKTTLDDASSAHFVLDSEGAPETGTVLVGGEGDLARPSSFEGTLKVLALGSSLDLAVVSVDGTVYAQLPFTSSFSEVDPSAFGFGDPGRCSIRRPASPSCSGPRSPRRSGEERRVDGEVVREVTAELPGELVEQLTSADPTEPVQATFSIVTESGELRRAELTGPFFAPGADATYTVDLSDFGADVEITAPLRRLSRRRPPAPRPRGCRWSSSRRSPSSSRRRTPTSSSWRCPTSSPGSVSGSTSSSGPP